MIDNELRAYITSMLKQGYDIDDIKEGLVRTGHDIERIEHLSGHVFEIFHKDILDFLDKEITKGRSIDEIKNDLIRVGHSDQKLQKIISHFQKKQPLVSRVASYPAFSVHKKFLGSLSFDSDKMKFILGGFVVLILVVVGALLFLTFSGREEISPLLQSLDRCERIASMSSSANVPSSGYSVLCRAMVHADRGICEEISEARLQQSCKDIYSLYTYYGSGIPELCSSIVDPSLQDYCNQIHSGDCNQFFGYGGHCTALVQNSLTACDEIRSGSVSAFLGTCRDNVFFYRAVRRQDDVCSLIEDRRLRELCVVVK
ncbi:MAG: hypothetical protein ACMXYE_03025 [Candidatus Woesearchaeota archaeon]